MKFMNAVKKYGQKFGAVALIAAAPAAAVLANGVSATNGADFQSIITTLTGWMGGTLGETIALAAVLVGLGVGIVRQSIMGVVVGIGVALVMTNANSVIGTMFTCGL